jgi:hypothetical protein
MVMPAQRPSRALLIGLSVGAVVLAVMVGAVGVVVVRALRIEPIEPLANPLTAAPAPPSPQSPPPRPSPSPRVSVSPRPWVNGTVGTPVALPSFELTVSGPLRCDNRPIAGKAPEHGFYCYLPVRLVNKGPSLRAVCYPFWLWVKGGGGLGFEPSDEATNAVSSNACDNPPASGATWEATVVFDATSGNGTWDAVGFTNDTSGDRARVML